MKIFEQIMDVSSDCLGNKICNDFVVDDTPENKEFMERMFAYGVDNDLWDDGCPPIVRDGKIITFDFMVLDYFKHKLSNEYIEELD